MDFSLIVADNESAVKVALDRGDNLQAFLLMHALIESLLRVFLNAHGKEITFHQLIQCYENFLKEHSLGVTTFIDELTQFNQRRNRIIHELWRKGYSFTNRQTEDAATASVLMYGLFIEFLQTFDPELSDIGFKYDE